MNVFLRLEHTMYLQSPQRVLLEHESWHNGSRTNAVGKYVLLHRFSKFG